MKYVLSVPVVLVFVVSMCIAEPNSVILRKVSLDDVSALGMKLEADTKVKVEGKSSIKITTKWPTSVCLGEVNDVNVENARLFYRAKVKSELKGSAFLEMWARVNDGGYFSRGLDSVISEKSDWKTLETPFIFQTGQKPDKVTLNIIINGRGTLWIDDIVLSKGPLEKPVAK